VAEITPDRQNYVAFNQLSNQLCNNKDNTNKPFKIFHQNIREIQGKINELMISLLNEKPNIICLTEHHLTDYEMDSLYIPKYKLDAGYGSKNVGVCIFLQEDLNFTTINFQKNCKERDIEIVAIQLKLNGNKVIIFST
jgi:hypothetical protein